MNWLYDFKLVNELKTLTTYFAAGCFFKVANKKV